MAKGKIQFVLPVFHDPFIIVFFYIVAASLLTTKVGFLYVGGHDAPFGRMQKLTKEIRELDNKIVECTMNQFGNWEFMRERTDKKLPNSFNTAVCKFVRLSQRCTFNINNKFQSLAAVVESIKHPITKEYLLNFIANFGFRDDHTMMPPPAAQRR